ncbi:hypothetical protein JW968_04805 [Candidatus Woesearchaeota archaeon]|nr:hypothetical protein [Candidatus Woesearchaeota archaeon]
MERKKKTLAEEAQDGAKEYEGLEEPYKSARELDNEDKEFQEEVDELTRKMFRKPDKKEK